MARRRRRPSASCTQRTRDLRSSGTPPARQRHHCGQKHAAPPSPNRERSDPHRKRRARSLASRGVRRLRSRQIKASGQAEFDTSTWRMSMTPTQPVTFDTSRGTALLSAGAPIPSRSRYCPDACRAPPRRTHAPRRMSICGSVPTAPSRAEARQLGRMRLETRLISRVPLSFRRITTTAVSERHARKRPGPLPLPMSIAHACVVACVVARRSRLRHRLGRSPQLR